MADVEACRIEFQCPERGHELEQTIGNLKSQARMICPGCGIGISIDATRLSNVIEEITITFYR